MVCLVGIGVGGCLPRTLPGPPPATSAPVSAGCLASISTARSASASTTTCVFADDGPLMRIRRRRRQSPEAGWPALSMRRATQLQGLGVVRQCVLPNRDAPQCSGRPNIVEATVEATIFRRVLAHLRRLGYHQHLGTWSAPASAKESVRSTTGRAPFWRQAELRRLNIARWVHRIFSDNVMVR